MKRLGLATLLLAAALAAGALYAQSSGTSTPATAAAPAAAVTNFAGTWNGCYTSQVFKQSIPVTLIFQQLGKTVTGTYLSKTGAQGVMYGNTLNTGLSASALQFSNICPGQFSMTATVTNGVLTWTFNGTDCKGSEIGGGTATQAPAAAPPCPPPAP